MTLLAIGIVASFIGTILVFVCLIQENDYSEEE